MIETFEDDYSNNMDELLDYLCREMSSREELAIANTRNKERASSERAMAEHYRQFYKAAAYYRSKAPLRDEPVDIRSRDIPEDFCKAASNRDEWKLYPNEKPNDNQNIAFVVKSTSTPHLNGKVLGGFYNENTENFSTPGVGFDATYWRPIFEAPNAIASK